MNKPASAQRPPRSATTEAADVALLARVASGDRQAFDALYRHYYSRVMRFLLRLLTHPQDAEEALNETMLVVWSRAASFNHTARVSTWIFGIAYRKALRQRPDPRRRTETLDEDTLVSEPDTQAQDLAHLELGARLEHAMLKLSPSQRAVVELTYFGDYSYPEIATIMDCPTGTVKTRMLHARRKLRHLLADIRKDL